MKINFDKMEGAGNDFILIDNRSGEIPDAIKRQLVIDYCRRAQGIGADGMIFIQGDPEFDFSWDFYNCDGTSAEMCGNGARCTARFAHKIGAAGKDMSFRTIAGPIRASLTERGAKVCLTDAKIPKSQVEITLSTGKAKLWLLNTGVPHLAMPVDNLEKVDVFTLGGEIRRHPAFAPSGANVNFFSPTANANGSFAIRTFERGVENETLACGTGSVAVGLVLGAFYHQPSPVTILTKSGEELNIYFTLTEDGATDIHLEGGAKAVFSGWFELPNL